MRKENSFDSDVRNFSLGGPRVLDPGVNIHTVKMTYMLFNGIQPLESIYYKSIIQR